MSVSTHTLVQIEDGLPPVKHLSLAQAQRLADALGIPMSDLFTAPGTPAPAAGEADTGTGDGALLGEVLHAARYVNVEIGDALVALGWDRKRYEAAEAALASALVGTGLHLHRLKGYVGLKADGADPATVERFKQAEAARVGIRRAEAKLIRQTALGLVTRANPAGFTSQKGGTSKADGRRWLLERGLLVHGDQGKGRVSLAPDLRYCLALDD